MTTEPAMDFSTGIENFRRRMTARMMRGTFRAGSVSAVQLRGPVSTAC